MRGSCKEEEEREREERDKEEERNICNYIYLHNIMPISVTRRFQGIMTYNAEVCCTHSPFLIPMSHSTSCVFIIPSNYQFQVPPSDLVRYDQLGSTVTLTVTVQNRGPSILSGDSNFASLNVYIPTRDSDSGSNFYLYPGYYTVTGATSNDDVSCDDRDFNVNNLRPPLDFNSSGRKKRCVCVCVCVCVHMRVCVCVYVLVVRHTGCRDRSLSLT